MIVVPLPHRIVQKKIKRKIGFITVLMSITDKRSLLNCFKNVTVPNSLEIIVHEEKDHILSFTCFFFFLFSLSFLVPVLNQCMIHAGVNCYCNGSDSI